MKSVEDLVTELCAVLREHGLEPPLPPRAFVSLDRIDELLAPARLPRAVRTLWESIDPYRLPVGIYPQLSDPDFGLQGWEMEHGGEGFNQMQPRHFFQLCYSSHDTMWVECDGPDWRGGALFESFISDPGCPFTLCYRSVEDWLDVVIATLRDGAFERIRDDHVLLDDDRHRELAAERLAAYEPDPVLGTQLEVPLDYEEWPPEWRRRSGIELEEPAVEDGISTIADVIRASRLEPVHATVRGRVLRRTVNRVDIYDATGQLQVGLPKAFSPNIAVGYEHYVELEMPARGEPPVRDPSFQMDSSRWDDFDRLKINADAHATKLKRAEGKSTEPEWNVADGAVVFHRLPAVDKWRPHAGPGAPEVGAVPDLLAAIPNALVRYIPPRPALNDLLKRGRVDPGERPGCDWTPLELSPQSYADLVGELEFEGTLTAPLTWGPFERAESPDTPTSWEDYVAWRDSLPGPPLPTVEDMATELARARDALEAAGDDPERVISARLDLWAAQRPAVLHLRERWRGRIHYRGWIELERLGTSMLEPTVDLFIAQRALWFAAKAKDAERIVRSRYAFTEAQQRLTTFLDEYGPGGTKPPGFEDTIERPRRWRPNFHLAGLPASNTLPPLTIRREEWISKLNPPSPVAVMPSGLAPGDLFAMTFYYGEHPPHAYVAVRTSLEWTTESDAPRPDDRAVEALAAAVRTRTAPSASSPSMPLDPDQLTRVKDQMTVTTGDWTINGENYAAATYSVDDAYAVIIGTPKTLVVVSGTAPLPGNELVTVTDLAPYEI